MRKRNQLCVLDNELCYEVDSLRADVLEEILREIELAKCNVAIRILLRIAAERSVASQEDIGEDTQTPVGQRGTQQETGTSSVN